MFQEDVSTTNTNSFIWPKRLFSILVLLIGFAVSIYGIAGLFRVNESTFCEVPQGFVKGNLGDPIATASGVSSFSDSQNSIHIDISGAIKNPGIYKLPLGSRLADVIRSAGGITKDADPIFFSKKLNLAQKLSDGDKFYIPFVGESDVVIADSTSLDDKSTKDIPSNSQSKNLISINEATAKELETLPNIGEKRASDIVNNRPFSSIDELVSKKIITQKTIDGFRDLISL